MDVVEKEEAHFDTEISEDDVIGEWKLRGQVLTRSPVRSDDGSTGIRFAGRNENVRYL